MYDSGLKVPMIIRYPDKARAGETDDQLISFIDFSPTTFSLAGIKPPAYLDGRAFAGHFESNSPRKYIHAAADRLDKERDMIRAVRDPQFKYLRNFKTDQGYYLPLTYREGISTMQELLRMRDAGELNEIQMQWFRESKSPEELFDTWKDPHQINDLAQDPAYSEKLAELRTECDRWMEDIDDKGSIPEGDLISSFWPDWEQPVTLNPEIVREGNLVTVGCPTPGANIVFQITTLAQESVPGKWEVYLNPVTLPDGGSLYVQAHRIGFKPSGDN
jgi:N-sulfoglucosamine sulfohydrolase